MADHNPDISKAVLALFGCLVAAVCPAQKLPPATIPGITYADDPGGVFASCRLVAKALGLSLSYDAKSDLAFLGSIPLDHHASVGGIRFVRLSALTREGATLTKIGPTQVLVQLGDRQAVAVSGAKSAEIELGKQKMSVYQGGALLFSSPVSTGRYTRSTPLGRFTIGSLKDAYHVSSKYGDAPMPWSVHVIRNVFIHAGHVPNYPASHGCIRLPMDTAEWFFRWCDPGTALRIVP